MRGSNLSPFAQQNIQQFRRALARTFRSPSHTSRIPTASPRPDGQVAAQSCLEICRQPRGAGRWRSASLAAVFVAGEPAETCPFRRRRQANPGAIPTVRVNRSAAAELLPHPAASASGHHRANFVFRYHRDCLGVGRIRIPTRASVPRILGQPVLLYRYYRACTMWCTMCKAGRTIVLTGSSTSITVGTSG